MKLITGDFLVRVIRILPNNQKGQVALEFILVIGFALGVTFLFMSQTFTSTKGYLLHYANYAASRVYLTYDAGAANVMTNYKEAEDRANEHLQSFQLDNLFGINADCDFLNFQQTNALFTGSVCKFKTTTNFFPIVGGGAKAELVSESFLGKEPVRSTCYQQLCEVMTGSKTSCRSQMESMDITLYDNGC